MIHDAHAFRGEYIDLCAQIERWALEVLKSAPAVKSGKAPSKPPHLFGQKMNAIGELTADEAGVFARPKRVRDILAELEPLLQLRSDLAHGTLSVMAIDTEELFAFEHAESERLPGVPQRLCLKRSEFPTLLGTLKTKHKELRDQKLAL